MDVILLFVVCLQYLCPVQGSSGVKRVFVLKGEDVRLEVQKPVKLEGESDDFIWKFKGKKNIFKYSFQSKSPSSVYKDRIEFSEENYSLLLKNLQEADSGLYHAVVSGEEEDFVANYSVIVQERVSPAVLTVTSVSSSPPSCNLTVTCRGQDSSVNSTFRCDNRTCSQEGGERSEVMTSTVPLYVYLLNGSIICNHSNQVSWSTNMREIQPLCPFHPGPKPKPFPWYIISITCVLGALVVIGVVLGLHYWKKRKEPIDDKEETENGNTVYAFPESPGGQGPVELTSVNPNSTYSVVGPHSAPIPAQPEQNTLIMKPGSEYAQVQKHGS
ncbi:SLAM family member 5-like [Polymixia lowei]